MTTAQNRTVARTYNQLANKVDQLIGHYGLEEALMFLEGWIERENQVLDRALIIRFVKDMIEVLCTAEYSMNPEDFGMTKTPEQKDCRNIGLRLLNRHLRLSFAHLGNHYGLTKRQVQYAIENCEHNLDSVHIRHEEFQNKYHSINRKVVAFITQLPVDL